MSLQIPQNRRVIGPIPPRDPKTRRMKIDPVLQEQPKLNILKEPIRDEKGQPVTEMVDQRARVEYFAWEPGVKPCEHAIKGLKLFQVDLAGEPLVQVYARHEDEALKVYKAEMGIMRFGTEDPKVTEVANA